MLQTLNFDRTRREARVIARTPGSLERFERARRVLAGGVSSSLRRHARPHPLYFVHGRGANVVDVDGNSYVDYGLAWGPLILGHVAPEISKAVRAQVERAATFGAQHDLEIDVAGALVEVLPCADSVCFANSGTEIVQVALRLARAVTGRQKFLKFEGHYHGWDDSVLVSHHPAAADVQDDGSPVKVGLGQRAHTDALVAQWNDRDAVDRLFAKLGREISAVICEPMLCNSGCIEPEPGFLEFLREISARYGALLIFDEVITGFRVHLAGAQGLYGVVPDLATYGKAIGGGLALSALAGKAQFMEWIADGRVVHAGTLNGNPLVLAAAKATLATLTRDDGAIVVEIQRVGMRLRVGLERLFRAAGYQVVLQGTGSVFQLSFMARPARNYRDTLVADRGLYDDLAVALLDEGVLVLPDGRWYISAAHTDDIVDSTLAAVERVLRR